MANKILHKRSAVAAKIPLSGDLDLGEMAINTTDGVVYLKTGAGDVVAVNPDNIEGKTLTNYGETLNAIGTAGATQDIDLSLGNVVTATIASATTFTFTTTHDNTSFTLLLTDASTNVTWPTVKWEGGTEPTWSTTGDDLVSFTKIGSVWIGGALIGVA